MLSAMYVYYRDKLGNVCCQVDERYGGFSDNIDFSGGFCFFTCNGKDYRIPVSALVAITHDIPRG